MKKSRVKKPSIKNLYRLIILIMIPVVLFAVFVSIRIRSAIEDQVLENAHATIRTQMTQLGDNLTNINYSLLQLLNEDGDIAALEAEDTAAVKRLNSILSLKDTFRELMNNYGGYYSFFYYEPEEDYFTVRSSGNIELKELPAYTARVVEYLKHEGEDPRVANQKWTVLVNEDNMPFLIKIYRSNENYLGVWLDFNSLVQRFGMNQYSTVNNYMFIARNNKLLGDVIQYQNITKQDSLAVSTKHQTQIKGNYEITYSNFPKGNFSFVFCINILEKYQNVRALILFLLTIVVAILATGILLLIYISRQILFPLNNFIDTLTVESFEERNKKRSLHFEEMDAVNRLFLSTKKQMEELRIAMYEKELERQKIEMEYLRLQIKPHFYLNCMNIIYHMAQSGHFEMIQRLSLEISDYFRSVIKKGSALIPLREELQHVQRYLNINKIRYGDELSTQILIPPELEGYLIAPLMIHTFAENSIKHALLGQSAVMIQILAEKVIRENREYLYICVKDNGKGFPEELLENLNTGKSLETEDGRRVGLANTLQRFKYFYHEAGKIVFSNAMSGGATVELWIPAVLEDRKQIM